MGEFKSVEEFQSKIKRVIISEEEIAAAIKKVGKQISDSYDGRPILLAGSDFGKDAEVEIEELTSGPVSVDDQEATLEAWSFTMTAMGETAKLRYLPPDEDAAEELAEKGARIMVRDAAGAWRDVAYTVEGSYFIFEISQQDEGFCLVAQEENTWLMYVLVGIGALVVVETAIFGAIRLRRRKR